MTPDEVKAAFDEQYPVKYGGVTYQRISALIYRRKPDGPGIVLQAELLDRGGNSVIIAAPFRIEKAQKRI